MTWANPTTQARVDFGQVLAAALEAGREYMREAEAQHARVKADAFFTEADRRASLTEVTLAHRAVSMLGPIAAMFPAASDETPTEVTAHRVVHPPAPGWSRAPDEVIGGLVGSLARALHSLAGCKHFDLHVSDSGGLHLYVDDATKIAGSFQAIAAVFGDQTRPFVSSL